MSEVLSRLQASLAGRYTIERPLGEGGMATVFLAHDLKHGRSVALKVLSPDLAAVIGPERFLREIQVTARLAHPHILPLLDSGEADGLLFYTMPVVDGESLRELLERETQLPVELAMSISAEVAEALDRAHEHGVVHRDIKPENILMDGDHALVADFGIAGMTEEGDQQALTGTGLAVGTCQYMSPEQISAQKVDGRSDVYSLACVTYEMLAGRPVFVGATVESIARQHLTTDPVALTTLRSALPRVVDKVVRKALAKTPVDRYATGAEFITDLRAAVESDVAPPDATRGRSLPWRVMLAGAAVVALVVALVSLVPRFTRSSPITSVAVLPLADLSADKEQEYFVEGIHDALITELGKLSAWRVVPRRSAMRYRDSDLAPFEIARELGVDALMDGTIVRVGDVVRLSLQLNRVSPDRTVWSKIYEPDPTDVLTMMRTITTDVATQIALVLTQGERTRLAEARPIDPSAYDAYLRGRYYLNQRSPEGFRLASNYFDQAITIDSGYAAAWADLSVTYTLMAQYNLISLEEGLSLARTAADRAIAADSSEAAPFASMGELYASSRAWTDAETAYRRAIDLDPTFAQGQHLFGWFLSHLGRHEEALQHLATATELDPLAPAANADYAMAFLHAGRHDDASSRAQNALDVQPTHIWVLWSAGMIAIASGDTALASEFADRLEKNADAYDYQLHMQVLGATGQDLVLRQLVREQVAEVGGRENVTTYLAATIASAFALLDDHDEALSWFEQAVDDGLGAGPIAPLVSPFFDSLRDDLRFERILARMGYP